MILLCAFALLLVSLLHPLAIDNAKHELATVNEKLDAFRTQHARIMSREAPLRLCFAGPTPDTNGYGNKLYSLVSALVVAVLSERALIVRWHGIEQYMSEPLKLAFHNFTTHRDPFNADYNTSNLTNTQQIVSNYMLDWQLNRNIDMLTSQRLDSTRHMPRVSVKTCEAYFMSLCANPAHYAKLSALGLVDNQTLVEARQALTWNATVHHHRLERLLRVGYQAGGRLLNAMWLPNAALAEQINHYVSNFFNGYFVIGIQLRYEFLDAHKDTDTFVRCALEIERLLSANESIGQREVKWFVTSDRDQYAQRLIKRFPDKVIVTEGVAGHISRISAAYGRTILDHELLSRCDEIIYTGGSTFGFTAAMKSTRMGYHVNGRLNMAQCKRTRLSIPPRRFNVLQYAVF